MEDSAKKQEKTGIIAGIKSFFAGVKAEFKKIIWPDKEATLKQSIAVVAISVVVGLFIAILDYFIQYGVNFVTSIGG